MPELLLAALSLLLALAALAMGWLLYRLNQATQDKVTELERRLQLQQQSISGLMAGALGVDRRLRGIDGELLGQAERQDTVERQQQAEQPYGEAIRLVKQGAATSRLVEELGISESEADLIVRLHGEGAPA